MESEAAEQCNEDVVTPKMPKHLGREEYDTGVIRILLADDHALVREGMRRLLEAEEDIQVVMEAANGEEAVAAALQFRPMIAIMDIAMPGMGGIEATRTIKAHCPEIAVLVLSAYDDEPYLFALLEAGAAGFLLKKVHGQDLVAAVHAVARGESVLQPELAGRVIQRLATRAHRQQNSTNLLSKRELDVLRLAARGLLNKEIASRLGVSIRTVHSHLANIFTKMYVGSRTEAIIVAIRQGLLTLEDTYDT